MGRHCGARSSHCFARLEGARRVWPVVLRGDPGGSVNRRAGVAVAPAERERSALSDDDSGDDDGDAVGEPFCLVHVVRRRKIVLPRSRRFSITSQAVRRAEGSKPVVGSSRKISPGSARSVRARSRVGGVRRPRDWLPACRALFQPDERDASRRRISAGCSSRRTAGEPREPSGPDRARILAGRSRCGHADSHASVRGVNAEYRHLAIERRRGNAPGSDGVVLPAPFGPRKANISPRSTSRSIPRAASSSSSSSSCATRAGVSPVRWGWARSRIAPRRSCRPSFVRLLRCAGGRRCVRFRRRQPLRPSWRSAWRASEIRASR